jgi:hypothetical protein
LIVDQMTVVVEIENCVDDVVVVAALNLKKK